MGLNFILMIVKAVAGIIGNSYALVADAIESASDVLSSMVVWIGLRTAAKPPDEDHPYGHGKAEPLAAVLVSLMLFGASVFIGIEAVQNIQTPHELPATWTLWVILIVIVGKELISRYVMRAAVDIESTAVKSEAWHHRADAITSLAAAIGIGVAVIGGKGYESADDWAAMLASFFIAANAYFVFKPAFSELMDKAVPSEITNDIRRIALQVEGVSGIEKCFVRKMGFELFVDIHIEVDGNKSVAEGHRIAHEVKNLIMQERKNVYDVLTHVEPFPAH
jgi:cation diffusion facilitator family transporter